MQVDRFWTTDVDVDVLGFLQPYILDVCTLPLLYRGLQCKGVIDINLNHLHDFEVSRTLSASLAKNTEPLPMPSVPFFFFPFLSTSETAHVLMSSEWARAAATRSAGSTYVLTGRGGYMMMLVN